MKLANDIPGVTVYSVDPELGGWLARADSFRPVLEVHGQTEESHTRGMLRALGVDLPDGESAVYPALSSCPSECTLTPWPTTILHSTQRDGQTDGSTPPRC